MIRIEEPEVVTPISSEIPNTKTTSEIPMEKETLVVKPTTTPPPIPTDRMVSVSIKSKSITSWYNQFWREIFIKVPTNWDGGGSEDIDDLLGPVFSSKNWILLQIGNVYYTHSGWGLTYGPEFGQLLRIIKNTDDPVDAEICLGTECYMLIDYTVLGRNAIGGTMTLQELFNDVHDGDIFIVTCDSGVFPGLPTPKLIVQLRPKPILRLIE